MRKPVLTLFYQFNLWSPTIGDIQTVIGNFIKYAPDDFEVRLVGTGVYSKMCHRWEQRYLESSI